MAKKVFPVDGPLAQSGTFSGKVAFSRGVKVDAGPLLFVSGALAVDENRQIVGAGDMGAQTRQVLRNLDMVLKEAGASARDVVKVTVFVKDITQFRAIHDARLEYFDPANLPASTMVEVSAFVHPDALIEIEMVAALPLRGAAASASRKARATPARKKSGKAGKGRGKPKGKTKRR